MDLVDEEHVPCLEVGEDRRQVAGSLDGRTGGDADVHPHLVRQNVCQRGFTQARGAVEQHMIE